MLSAEHLDSRDLVELYQVDQRLQVICCAFPHHHSAGSNSWNDHPELHGNSVRDDADRGELASATVTPAGDADQVAQQFGTNLPSSGGLFVPMEYLGTSFDKGAPTSPNKCMTGFDNAGVSRASRVVAVRAASF